MEDNALRIKLGFIPGLRAIVTTELSAHGLATTDETDDAVYVQASRAALASVLTLRSVARAYLVMRSEHHHPAYLANHKSQLGGLIEQILPLDTFATFSIRCAGADSAEVRSIAHYIETTYHLTERDEADLKIHIAALDGTWEVGAQITARPLSLRAYKEVHIPGAMDPTIAYAANTLAGLESAHSYLNPFSGSATLLIEAALAYPHLDHLVGFDRDKKRLSAAIRNLKRADLLNRVRVVEADINDPPALGTFDAIVSDLPFGMAVAKHEDLGALYAAAITYSKHALAPHGRLVLYTSAHELLTPIIRASGLTIISTTQLTLSTNINTYLHPQIVVCEHRSHELSRASITL